MSTADGEAALTFAHDLATVADRISLPQFRNGIAVSTKEDVSPVVAARRRIEAELRQRIRDRFPSHGVLSADGGEEDSGRDLIWVIHPIDGSCNYASGIPVFATLLALRHQRRTVVGVVSAPALGQRWSARRGGGAFENDAPISVRPCARLSVAIVGLGEPSKYAADRNLRGLVERMSVGAAGVSDFGDFRNHALVATGAIDLAIDTGLQTWEVAALEVIVEEAGGVLRIMPDPLAPGRLTVVTATAGLLAAEPDLLEILGERHALVPDETRNATAVA
jgi:histidinol-phosphatase